MILASYTTRSTSEEFVTVEKLSLRTGKIYFQACRENVAQNCSTFAGVRQLASIVMFVNKNIIYKLLGRFMVHALAQERDAGFPGCMRLLPSPLFPPLYRHCLGYAACTDAASPSPHRFLFDAAAVVVPVHEHLAQVKKFFKEHPVPNSERKLAQMLESMEINVRFFKTVAASPLSTDAFWEGLEG